MSVTYHFAGCRLVNNAQKWTLFFDIYTNIFFKNYFTFFLKTGKIKKPLLRVLDCKLWLIMLGFFSTFVL